MPAWRYRSSHVPAAGRSVVRIAGRTGGATASWTTPPEHVRALAVRVLDDLEAVTDRLVAAIVDADPTYGEGRTSAADLRQSCHDNVRRILQTLTGQSSTLDTTIATRRSRYWEHPITGPLIYVSPTGNDASVGTRAAPRATIASAYALLISQQNKGRGGAVVLLNGTYYQRNTLDGADNYATRDTGYQIVAENWQQAIISVDDLT